ncbi:MAG: hypothetical protein EA407_06000 [Rhodobacteraceae bacterium]|nr:MAG: hypothetical protein EA407_06000 [Paracoccaceae bacterium]
MSAFTSIPATGALSASYREPVVQLAQPAAARAVQATSRPMLPFAVEQTLSSDRSVASFLKQTQAQLDRNSRLVGPPPAFQVNLLQDIRESKLVPDQTQLEPTLPFPSNDQRSAIISERQDSEPDPMPHAEPSGSARLPDFNVFARVAEDPQRHQAVDLTL